MAKSTRKAQDHREKKIAKGIEKKSGVGIVDSARVVEGTGKQDYRPSGKYKEQLQVIGESLISVGFNYVKDKNQHHKFKHKTCRFCQTSFPDTPSDHRTIKNIVSTIKRMCQVQCVPPIPLDKLPAKLFTIKMAGLVDKDVEELFPEGSIKEITILDVLNEITKTVTLSAQVDREIREELRRIADQKGITLGDLIEDMKEVYEKSQ